MGVEPTSSAWKADVLAVVRHLHASDMMYYSTVLFVMQAYLWYFFNLLLFVLHFYKF